MTKDAYADYHDALVRLVQLPDNVAERRTTAVESHAKAIALADKAVTDAEHRAQVAEDAVLKQLSKARELLQPIGVLTAIPSKVLPTEQLDQAVQDDVNRALAALAEGVKALDLAVKREKANRTDDERRRAKEEADRIAHLEQQRKRRQQMMVGVAALVALLLIIILAVSLG
jgi:predicted nucleic acid-binding Zn ribbon protein